MAQLHSLRTFLSAALATFALTTVTYGQTPQPAQKNAKQASPVTMTECEGVNNCATWTFLGAQGNGQWPSGEVANLSVERYDDNSVVIRRADSTGGSAGLTATYTGTRHGDQVGGEFTSSWPGHWTNKSGNWYATVEKAPQGPPSVMHFCAAHCLTFTLEKSGQLVNYTNLPGQSNEKRVFSIESFTPASVVIRRTDYGSFPGATVYKGRMAPDGNSVSGDSWKITWGAAT